MQFHLVPQLKRLLALDHRAAAGQVDELALVTASDLDDVHGLTDRVTVPRALIDLPRNLTRDGNRGQTAWLLRDRRLGRPRLDAQKRDLDLPTP
ncbi:hypothetical protein GCM10022211_01730 [Sphingomonas humi]|uniref:Uncharacterized protein n=1 Tax=Sphingomonas humi TaxID=335630 RepID=A0ABP7RER9_9SPHN